VVSGQFYLVSLLWSACRSFPPPSPQFVNSRLLDARCPSPHPLYPRRYPFQILSARALSLFLSHVWTRPQLCSGDGYRILVCQWSARCCEAIHPTLATHGDRWLPLLCVKVFPFSFRSLLFRRSSGWIPVGSALGVSVYVGDGPSSRDVEAGNQDRNSSGAGTVWRTGGQSQAQPSGAMGPTTSQTMHPQEVFPGSGRTLANSGGGGVMNALWSSQTTAESKSDRAEMAARRLAALGRGGESQPNAPPFNQYVAGVASAPNSSSSSKSLTTLTVRSS
jgi:hypothetical protein